jgi:hypothetical protein
MTIKRLTVAGAMAIALAGPVGAAPTGDERPRIGVYIKNYPDVGRDDLARARTEVEQIFAPAGVSVAWVEADDPDRITVLLLSITRDSREDSAGCALGLALASKSTAYVFVNRIVKATQHRPVDLPVVLGRVIAHEIGHVLMPQGQHSRFGIMRADLDLGYANPGNFSDVETRRIQSRLRANANK